VFITTFSHTKFPLILKRFIFPDGQYRVRLLHRPQADALFVSKGDQHHLLHKEDKMNWRTLIWPLLKLFTVTMFRFVKVLLFVFPIKQFCLLITTNYNFDKNYNFQRAVAKFVKIQQPEFRVTPVKAAS